MQQEVTSRSSSAEISTELAARRTGMSFQRTRLSAERTLMSIIRTALSLIGFGFTIYQFFGRLEESHVLKSGSGASRHFGLSLVLLGVGMLAVGIGYHASYMLGLRRERKRMVAEGLIHGESQYPVSLTLLVALCLLGLGIVAIASMTFHVGPFE